MAFGAEQSGWVHARRERRQKANAEFDEKITQRAAQLETEEGLKNLSKRIDAFIESMHRGANGHQ